MERVQATLDHHGGRFLVHGGSVEVREGDWPGTLVLIEFPDLTAARDWYESDAYAEIRQSRTHNVPGAAILVDGVPDDYDPAETVGRLRREGHGC
jgi:uncharacterized protein (DUF1330 family)